MKRRITLYINGERAEVSDDALVLLNYAITDISNPAVIKNSYSQTVTLPGTEANNRIFGASFRLDRTVGPTGFNASQRTPFAIYRESGEILASGYCRLDRVLTQGGAAHSYDVTLFGGLGSFIYEMSMKDTGDKMSLADLDYGEDLDFVINAQTVADAWARLGGDSSKPAKWDTINFAPALNGIPKTSFAADRAVAIPTDIGLPAQEDTHTTKDGYTLITLADNVDEWAAKDLRSYLQRPVVSVRKIIEAIARTSSWNVDTSDLADVPFLDAWLTRPLLPSLGGYKQAVTIVTLTPSGTSAISAGDVLGQFDVTDAPAGSTLTARMRYTPAFKVDGLSTGTLYPVADLGDQWLENVIFIQAVGYASDDTKVAAGPVVALYQSPQVYTPEEMAQRCGYTPDPMNTAFENGVSESGVTYDGVGGIFSRSAGPVSFGIEGQNIDYIKIVQSVYTWDADSDTAQVGAALFNGAPPSQVLILGATAPDAIGTGTVASGDTLRSGATVTKELMLSSSKTPAEYLISICKMLGMYIVADAATKSVRIIKRKSFFVDETIDLSRRIDRIRDIDLHPIPFEAKWYELRQDGIGGAFEQEYKQTEGVQYGIKRLDTGYDFDAEVKDLLQGSALRSCAEVLNYSTMLNVIMGTDILYPSPFVKPGNTFTLWDESGDGEDYDVPVIPISATVDWLDTDFPGYDKQTRAEFRDKDGNAIEGADVLLMHTGAVSYDQIHLTDDLAIMDILGIGPCWQFIYQPDASLSVPSFQRVTAAGEMLDFGMPRQVCSPVNFLSGCVPLYDLAWKKYMTDRLDVNGKVLRCMVHLDGLQVGPELLRRFYWYGGSLWSLVKISNYSLTTFDPAECEFVQVRDKSNYLTGQY